MSIIEAIILGFVQGLTEFIPVSSSGHLVLVHTLFGEQAGGLTFDVALHIGTLLSLFVYFRKDVWQLLLGLFGKNDKQRLAWMVALATLPAVAAGVLLGSFIENQTRSVLVVAAGFALVGACMLITERYAHRQVHTNSAASIGPRHAISVGLAQAAALIPGVSRSGATITAGLALGLSRVEATRFSFLMAIPIIAGAGLKTFLDADFSLQSIGVMPVVVGMLTAFISGLLAISFLLKYLATNTLRPFAYYLLVMSVVAIGVYLVA